MPALLPATVGLSHMPALAAAAGERASMRFLEFFAANVRNPHTRRPCYRATEEFLAWCAEVGVPSRLDVDRRRRDLDKPARPTPVAALLMAVLVTRRGISAGSFKLSRPRPYLCVQIFTGGYHEDDRYGRQEDGVRHELTDRMRGYLRS